MRIQIVLFLLFFSPFLFLSGKKDARLSADIPPAMANPDSLIWEDDPVKSFKTDTSLNDDIALYHNIEKILPKLNLGSLQEFEALLMEGDEDEGMPTALFISEDSTQYLRLEAAKGSALGDIEAFEVGYLEYLHTNHQKTGRCTYADFTTEHGLHLDMKTEDIQALKGPGLAIEKDGFHILYYSDEELDFPYDFARFYFKNNKLVRFRCGYHIP